MREQHSIEKTILGSMIQNTKVADKALGLINQLDFELESHQKTYKALETLRLKGRTTEPLMLINQLDTMGMLEDAGGEVRIASLIEHVTAATNFEVYCKKLRKRRIRRDLYKSFFTAHTNINENNKDIDKIISSVESSISSARTMMDDTRKQSKQTSEEAMRSLYEYTTTNPEDQENIQWPWAFLNKVGNIERGNLIVIPGYSGDGKSCVGLQFLESMCKQGLRVGYFSQEMPNVQVVRRLSATNQLPFYKLKNRTLTNNDKNLLIDKVGEISEYNFITYEGQKSVGEIRSESLGEGFDIVIIDHLHRIKRTDRRDLELIAEELKNIALDGNCVVIALCQLRKTDGYPEPNTNLVRETGVIEQESDWMLSVWQQRNDGGQERYSDMSRLRVLKARDGEPGIYLDCVFNTDTLRFESKL